MGDVFGFEQVGQVAAAEDSRRHDHDGGTDAERHRQLVDGCVETRRRDVRHTRIPSGAESLEHLGLEVGQATVPHCNALRATGRTRGVDQVGGVVDVQGRRALDVGHRVCRIARQLRGNFRIVQHQPRNGVGQRFSAVDVGQTHCGTGIFEHVRDSVRRVVRIDGQEGGTGLGHSPHRQHRLDRSRQRQRDERLGTDAVVDQHSSDSVGPAVEIGVRQADASVGDGDCVRVERDGRREQLRPRPDCRVRVSSRRHQLAQLVGAQNFDVSDHRVSVASDGIENSNQSRRDGLDAGRVEQRCGVVERGLEAGRTPVLVEGLGQQQLQILLGHGNVEVEALHA